MTLPNGQTLRLELQVPGLHNLRNATAVLGVALALNAPLEPVLAALARYRGLGRRFERLGEVRGVEFVDDYAHHPTELVATIAAARQAFPEPATGDGVPAPPLLAHREHGVAMGRPCPRPTWPSLPSLCRARTPIPGVTGRSVADAANLAGAGCRMNPIRAQVDGEVAGLLREGDLLITLGAGDMTRVGPAVVAGSWPI